MKIACAQSLGLFTLLVLAACGDDEPKHTDSKDAGTQQQRDAQASKDAGSGDAAADGGSDKVYAYIQSVDESVFVTLTRSMDFKSGDPELDPKKAREFRGNVIAVNGNLLEVVESTINQWKVTDTLELEQGASINFSEFPLAEGANDFFQYQVDAHHMYLPFDVVNRVVWDPTDMKIVKVLEGDSKIPTMVDGLMSLPAGNRSKIVYQGDVRMPVFYLDEEYVHFAEHTALGVYDANTHAEKEVVDLPCPGLAIATQDEEGHTYYGTWDYSPLLALYNQGPKPCLARLTADGKLDEAWTTDLTDLTEGRYGANFYYVRDGWGVMDVLHQETLDLDFTAKTIPEDALSEVWDKSHWQIWFVDLKNKKAHPMTELGDDIHLSFWALQRVDERVFLNLSTEDEGSKLYELDKTGKASLFDEARSGVSWVRVR